MAMNDVYCVFLVSTSTCNLKNRGGGGGGGGGGLDNVILLGVGS